MKYFLLKSKHIGQAINCMKKRGKTFKEMLLSLFHTCGGSTRFKNSTVADAIRVNKIIQYLKNANSFVRIPQFDKHYLRLQIFTDASFNNLPNGGS